jgi:signal transduction histidine kinase
MSIMLESLGIGLLLLLLGGLLGYGLAWQQRRQRQQVGRAGQTSHHRRRCTGSFVRLARMQAADLDEALMQISITAAHTLDVDQTSIWLVQPDKQAIVCKEMYFSSSGRHEAGIVVPLAKVSAYLAALDAGRCLPIADVQHDPRSQELWEDYLQPHGVRSMLDVPIRVHGRLVGILCHESTRQYREWTLEEEAVAATLGDLAALTCESFAHRQVEADLRQRNRDLRATQERLEAVLGALAEGLLITDESGQIQRGNTAAATLLGHPLAELIDQPIGEALTLSAEPANLRDSLVTLDRPLGAVSELRVNRSQISEGGSVITLRDVTTEEQVNRLKSDFIAIASHELRTPLTIIQGYVGLLLMGESSGMAPARRQEILNSIRMHTDRLSRLIRDVLNVARLEADALPTHPESVDVTRLIRETLDLLGPQAHTKGIRLLARYGEKPLPTVWADSGHLLQILSNLVENAIKYSPPDRQVLIEAIPIGSMLRLTVSDQGIGIPPEEQAHIFSRFHRVHTPLMLRERGSGLGLFIARRLAEAQGGTLLVSSQPGTGSTFAVTVPLAGAQTRAAESGRPAAVDLSQTKPA